MTDVMLSQSFIANAKNGISRDAESLVEYLASDNTFKLKSISNSNFEYIMKIIFIFRTVIFRKPKFYNFGSCLSLIPQLENYIPTVKGSALIRIHDVFPITNPKWFRRLSANAFRITLSRAVEDGHTFICNSKYTEASFLEIFPTAVTFVLYCNPKRPPLLACRKCSHCKLAEIPSKKYLISVGTIEPRKNFHTLVSSWNKVKDQVGINLIIVGRYGWKSKKTLKVIQHSGSSIIYIDDICDYGLSELISKSSGYVSVSLDEGFNFPAMDAALAGVPLIISDIPIHRELYGDSPYYFNPKNTYDIQKGLKSEYREAPKISGEFLNKNQEFDKDLKKIFEFVNLKMLGGNL